jgi:hypothetical protein
MRHETTLEGWSSIIFQNVLILFVLWLSFSKWILDQWEDIVDSSATQVVCVLKLPVTKEEQGMKVFSHGGDGDAKFLAALHTLTDQNVNQIYYSGFMFLAGRRGLLSSCLPCCSL